MTVDGVPRKAGFGVREGMTIAFAPIEETPAHDLTPADLPIDVLYEDADVLVVSKPRNLATHPAPSLREPSLVNVLLARGTSLSSGSEVYRPGIVHRLDKETTGLLLVAKNDAAHRSLAGQIERREVDRRYAAVIHGDLDEARFRIDAPIARDVRNRLRMAIDPKGKAAATEIRLVRRLEKGSLVLAKLETGRTHQIRVHLAGIGHPVKGDRLYAPGEWAKGALQLHAATIGFTHPTTGAWMQFFASPPDDFEAAELVTESIWLAP